MAPGHDSTDSSGGQQHQWVCAAFYKFVRLDNLEAIAEELERYAREHNIQGTVLLAPEGINSTSAGKRADIDGYLSFIRSMPPFTDLVHKESFADSQPFWRYKVLIKNEIVKIGKAADAVSHTGTLVEPKDWNALISQPDVVLIDTRNKEEVEIGTFEHAIDPLTDTFTQFPEYVSRELEPLKGKKRIAMFCTGGIRCEKASAYMLEQGFPEVFQLHGGILKYLEEVQPEQSLWKGECFVFDNRVSVKHGLEPGSYQKCHSCRHTLTAEDLRHPDYRPGLSCRHCAGSLTEEQLRAKAKRQRQAELCSQRGLGPHIGMHRGPKLKQLLAGTGKKSKKRAERAAAAAVAVANE
eukprot:TRINITY_DN972_c0_g1_i1.p1 TRINITY_DN972_c0_g1~~TRINITY_DN972_c0_g1_i1.p1  ORF type:complete len:352 (+),score=84.93 TRINITY_DN972_c0_g1_i1:50-1105(+)